MSTRLDDLARLRHALRAAEDAIRGYTPGDVEYEEKSQRGDPLTAADLAANEALLGQLRRDGEGWLSEETEDEAARLQCKRVWVVDPVDGTREFVDGIPEWCISVGLVENGDPVAGGILNPATGQLFLGAIGLGVTLNGVQAGVTRLDRLAGARVLASRSEVKRGEWRRYQDAPFKLEPCGSVAYKLALVAAGLADATWTLVPKHEWDVAAGVALVLAAGGEVLHVDGSRPRFNRPKPELPDLMAGPLPLLTDLRERWPDLLRKG
jgi:myo-inositol-1(or 4)-monophosphatase